MIKLLNIPRILLIFVTTVSVFNCNVTPLFGQDSVSVSGITESIKDVTLSVSVSGRISKIFLKEGDRVSKGQIILNLDKGQEELEVQRRKLLWESKTEVESAARKEATLKSLLDSTRALFESTRSVSREELEKMELEYLLSVAERQGLEIAENREQIEYNMARNNLAERFLRSPIQGRIIKLFLKEGEGCEPNQPLVHVVDTSECLFVCNVEEHIGRTMKKGQSVDLKIRTGASFINKKGVIVFVSPVVDQASGLLEIKSKFINRDGKVRPGVSGTMRPELPKE